MCREPATAGGVRAAMPHPAAGSAADPIALQPADDVVVTTLVDNVYDALLTGGTTITRAPLAAGTARAPQFEPGRTNVGLMAEHGFSALVTFRRGDTTTSVLFDTGLTASLLSSCTQDCHCRSMAMAQVAGLRRSEGCREVGGQEVGGGDGMPAGLDLEGAVAMPHRRARLGSQ